MASRGCVQLGRAAWRTFSTTPRCCLFWEKDAKGGYGEEHKFKISMISDGFKRLGGELKMFGDEMKAFWESDPVLAYLPGVEHKVFDFESPKDLDRWVCTSDSDNSEGYSKGALALSPAGHGLFSGVLSTEVPKDGVVRRSGYCSIRSLRARKSFQRESHHDWTNFSHLVVRCRGDGRTYMLNIFVSGFFDQTWNDVYHFPLHTRGGPYWQTTRIPFSKFFFASKGRIQDLQNEIALDQISHFGITIADKVNGSFQLEIDHISLLFDPSESETFAYEKYRIPKGLAAT